jgi:hypothetical protein
MRGAHEDSKFNHLPFLGSTVHRKPCRGRLSMVGDSEPYRISRDGENAPHGIALSGNTRDTKGLAKFPSARSPALAQYLTGKKRPHEPPLQQAGNVLVARVRSCNNPVR